MKKVIILILLLAMLPSVFAEITVKTSQPVYNIGNSIGSSVSVARESSFEGLFKMSIDCGSYKLDYFLTPLKLESNFVTAVNIPELTASKAMVGKCNLLGSILSEGQFIEQSKLNDFIITNQLTILPIQGRVTALPADSVQIAGIINAAFGNNVLKATAAISLENQSIIVDSVDGKFNATLRIPKNIKSNLHSFEISAADSKGNSAKSSIELYVNPIPSHLTIDLTGSDFLHGKKLGITSTIFDQADDAINDSLDLEMDSPSNEKIFAKIVQSNERIDYEFSQYSKPGIYSLKASYRNIIAQANVNITKIREVKIKYQNESVFVENIGNVLFEDELSFVLQSSSNKYPIIRMVKIEPGKTLVMDLSKEVPFGIYDILFPLKEGFDLVSEKLNITLGNLAPQNALDLSGFLPGKDDVLADDVVIHDNRPVYKKVASGFSSVSTFLVGADGVLTKNPIVAPMIILSIILLIFIRYAGKPILRMLRRDKKVENKDKEEK